MAFVAGIIYSTIEIIDLLVPGPDLQTGRSLYNHLRDLTPQDVPRVRRHTVGSETEFWDCLDAIESEAPKWKPIIHIEAHAGKNGIELGHGAPQGRSIIPWQPIVDQLRKINVASEFNLGVFVAACEGIEALRPMTIKKPAPFMFVVGPNCVVSAEAVENAAQGFYSAILGGTNLNRAFGTLPPTFTHFLAERFFAKTYARVLRAQSFGRRRLERVDQLVKMVLPENAAPEQLRAVRDQAKIFSRPDRERFEAAQRAYLPAGVSYSFDELVEFARTGQLPR